MPFHHAAGSEGLAQIEAVVTRLLAMNKCWLTEVGGMWGQRDLLHLVSCEALQDRLLHP